MPKSNKTTASSTVTKSAIDHATSILEELPEKPKENWSLREAVAHLQVQISSALAKGYSYEEIAGMLTERGIDISASSLKSYLSAAKRQKEAVGKPGKPGRRSRKALNENSTIVEAASLSANGTAATGTAAKDSGNGAKPEPAAEPAELAAPRKRRTRSTAASSQPPAASKTAAKSKAAPRTKSTAAEKAPTKRTKR